MDERAEIKKKKSKCFNVKKNNMKIVRTKLT